LYWRGVWGLLDHYFFPGNFLLSHILSATIGIALLYIIDSGLRDIE
jgi:hypothetical protein